MCNETKAEDLWLKQTWGTGLFGLSFIHYVDIEWNLVKKMDSNQETGV